MEQRGAGIMARNNRRCPLHVTGDKEFCGACSGNRAMIGLTE